MLRFLCGCCCFTQDDRHSERQRLIHPAPCEITGATSARQTRSTHTDAQGATRIGKLVMRRVNVPDLDRRFSDMAETFNEQQERYEAMVQHIKRLKQSCDCTQTETLSFAECVDKIRAEQNATYTVSLLMKTYDFSLSVLPVSSEVKANDKPLPSPLQFAQDMVKGTSDNAKATISKGTTMQEMIGWLLRSQNQMAKQVNGAAVTYQEQGRLAKNLEENLNEVRRAKELSQRYRKQAGEVLSEAAQIAGAHV